MRYSLALMMTAALPLALAGCVGTGEPQGGPVFALVNHAGQSIGSVRMWETPGGVTFRIGAAGLPHGIHGIHVHSVGRCDPPRFESSGPHFNPTGARHGFNNPAGPHRGDLPNITVPANGVLQEALSLPGTSFGALLDADGAALVIHSNADDYATDPSGNSGGRIACGVIAMTVPAAR
ncbi:superoxide dismutase family protein [Sphingomonas sp.]|jgi:Cu-Zn family superoxide dismutase|uniref:superoxide dismutase family protein n=1 Tax=Sphingomonas sp. TaxID=28214 RepID=UPI00183EAC05|nr:superoxide dismutase family protein [Sphingomonas sp.]MBA3511295.1 superoxide dismutase family protein [Sphingomonas sp.]